MAAVTIDLGFGKQATLSTRTTSGALTVQQRQDADEFVRDWASSSVGQDIHGARDTVQRLGLHVAYGSPNLAQGDPVALLKSAVTSGRVSVVIERPTTKSGGGASAPARPQRRAMMAGPTYQPFSALADDGGASMFAPLGGIVSAVGVALAGTATDVGPNLASSLLGDAQPFDLGDTPLSDPISLAMKKAGLSDADEALCHAQYMFDMEFCAAMGSPMGGSRGLRKCQQNAWDNYQRCRGY
ncbi:hypothetical protein [Burkholderia cenocepacia]|uniref:hypothetical protein n=1 Tax=Burkholderia cenocepacia TaxID=95486 RepID=UPI001B99E240|nr:hypothetical protein [Burkholderia cenocepacia]MBR8405551.1 hypothetical protein [Burkholderia cenocepacia]